MVNNGCKDSAVLCKSHQFSFISIAACVLVLICPDIGSAPRWTCLTWPGCGSRLRSEGRTPETLSPETCCGSMTPFSWNTRVIHKSYIFNCALLQTNIIMTRLQMCVFVSQMVSPGWASVRFLSRRMWVCLAGGGRTTGIHITSSTARGLQSRMVRAHCILSLSGSFN